MGLGAESARSWQRRRVGGGLQENRRGGVPILLEAQAKGQVDPAAVVCLSTCKAEHQLGSHPSGGYIRWLVRREDEVYKITS